MFKIKNIEITDSDWLDTAKMVIEEITACQDIEELSELDNMILNEETMNEEYVKGEGSLLERLKENNEVKVEYETPGGFGWIKFDIVMED